jgi:hypothetical protein
MNSLYVAMMTNYRFSQIHCPEPVPTRPVSGDIGSVNGAYSDTVKAGIIAMVSAAKQGCGNQAAKPL